MKKTFVCFLLTAVLLLTGCGIHVDVEIDDDLLENVGEKIRELWNKTEEKIGGLDEETLKNAREKAKEVLKEVEEKINGLGEETPENAGETEQTPQETGEKLNDPEEGTFSDNCDHADSDTASDSADVTCDLPAEAEDSIDMESVSDNIEVLFENQYI